MLREVFFLICETNFGGDEMVPSGNQATKVMRRGGGRGSAQESGGRGEGRRRGGGAKGGKGGRRASRGGGSGG